MNRRRLPIQVIAILAAGTVIGWLYDYPFRGLLAAALLLIAWQTQRLLSFDRALRTRNFDAFRLGDGIWQQMLSRFRYERGRARQYKRRYRKLLKEVRESANAMPEGGIILDESLQVVHCNTAAQSLAGFDARKDRGQPVVNILRAPRFIRYLESGEYDGGVEIASPVREGDWLYCRLVPYGGSQHLLLIRDITERRQMATMRRDFIANASHELRSPLTVISGYLDTLADDEAIPGEWRMPIAQMQTQANRMNQIVAEMLELSRVEAAGPGAQRDAVDIATVIAAAKSAFDGIPGLATVNVDIRSEALVCGSSAELESVVSNLLSNALRHTPASGTITMSWTTDQTGGALAVSDNGDGIDEQHLPRLTERFFRVDSGRARTDGGVGLGLAIVKHILLRHDATLEISSTLGAGSRFVCRFPLSRLSTARQPGPQ